LKQFIVGLVLHNRKSIN